MNASASSPITSPPLAEKTRRAAFGLWHEVGLAILLLAVLAYAGWKDKSFLAFDTQLELASHIWELAILAVPMTLIILTGGIDLSVGSTMALCAVVLGLSYERGVSPFIGALLAVATGIAAGWLNGIWVARGRVHPLIVTLATLAAYRGIAEGISTARPISGFPAGFSRLSTGTFLSVPIPALIFLLAALAAATALKKTPFGLSLFAIGHNETATRYSGIEVDRFKVWLYTLSGLASGVTATLFVARLNTAKADIASGMELNVITAVVLGGTSIFGGRGTILGTVLGVLLIHETNEFVSWHWERDELNALVLGTLLIASVLLNGLLHRERDST